MRIRFPVFRTAISGESANSYWAKATNIAEEVSK
jgi:hypothetical protein